MSRAIAMVVMVTLFGCQRQVVVEQARAEQVPVVLRVDCQEKADVCEKYCWQNVRILKIFKNQSDYAFGDRLAVAHYNWDSGIPLGVSTIYLEQYSPVRPDAWRLLGGSKTTGTSHYQKPQRQKIITEQKPQRRRIIHSSGEPPSGW